MAHLVSQVGVNKLSKVGDMLIGWNSHDPHLYLTITNHGVNTGVINVQLISVMI
jgi:hypothetical protein